MPKHVKSKFALNIADLLTNFTQSSTPCPQLRQTTSYFALDVQTLGSLDDLSLSIINIIISHMNHFKHRAVDPGYARIAKLIGCSTATVKRRMKQLRLAGILPYFNRINPTNGWHKTNLYYLADYFYIPQNIPILRQIFRAMWFSLWEIIPTKKNINRATQSELSTKRDPIYLNSDFLYKHQRDKINHANTKSGELRSPYKAPLGIKRLDVPKKESPEELRLRLAKHRSTWVYKEKPVITPEEERRITADMFLQIGIII